MCHAQNDSQSALLALNLYDLFPEKHELLTTHASTFCLDLALSLDQAQKSVFSDTDLFARMFKTLVKEFLERNRAVLQKVSLDSQVLQMCEGEGGIEAVGGGKVRENLCHLMRRGSFGKEVEKVVVGVQQVIRYRDVESMPGLDHTLFPFTEPQPTDWQCPICHRVTDPAQLSYLLYATTLDPLECPLKHRFRITKNLQVTPE